MPLIINGSWSTEETTQRLTLFTRFPLFQCPFILAFIFTFTFLIIFLRIFFCVYLTYVKTSLQQQCLASKSLLKQKQQLCTLICYVLVGLVIALTPKDQRTTATNCGRNVCVCVCALRTVCAYLQQPPHKFPATKQTNNHNAAHKWHNFRHQSPFAIQYVRAPQRPQRAVVTVK